MNIDRIRIKNYKGYKMEIWLRYDKKKGEIYSYKVTTPEGENWNGREYLPDEFWDREQILDGLIRGIQMLQREKAEKEKLA